MKKLKKILDSLAQIPKESKESFLAIINSIDLKKGDSIAKSGEIHTDIFILNSGVARSYYTNEKGKEYIRNIFIPTKAVGALGSLILKKPSRYSYDCLSDCSLYTINFEKFKALATTDINISNLYAKVLEYVFLELEAKIYDLSVFNATERYLKLKRRIPEIENLIPQYHIASFLNITPVQLSRIRKELYTKK